MAILGFSLSTGVCQLAWHHDGKFKEQSTTLKPGQTHAGVLTSLIKEFLPMPPCVIATTTGPGSFTSIRIQLATAIGLKIGYGAQLFCPNTLDLLQWAFDGAIPAIDSFRGDYFTKIENTVTCITEQELNVLKAKGKTICGDVGQAPENIATHLLRYYLSYPNPESLKTPVPYYVRTPEYKTRSNISG
jgi:tRNA A37 threonylcarbamoyladenosine modification protein TsaB